MPKRLGLCIHSPVIVLLKIISDQMRRQCALLKFSEMKWCVMFAATCLSGCISFSGVKRHVVFVIVGSCSNDVLENGPDFAV